MECKENHHLLETAEALLLLGIISPVDRPSSSTTHLSKPHKLPPAAMPVTRVENAVSVCLPPWGFCSRKSRYTGKSKLEQVELPASTAAAAVICSHRSPDTPLDLGVVSDPSTSESDGFPSCTEIPPPKRFRCGKTSAPRFDAHTKVRSVERSPVVVVVRPSSQPIKRQGSKKTKSELKAEERLLLEDKNRLMKMLEFEMTGKEAVLAENRRLLSELASSQRTPAVEAESVKLKFVLPDLNEPLLEHREQGFNDNYSNTSHCYQIID